MYKTVFSIVCLTLCLPAGAATIHVRQSASGASDGTSWRDAHTSLSDAIARARAGDDIWVAAGTYHGPIALKNGVRIVGGFRGVESSIAASNPDANPTLIDGGGKTRAVKSIANDASAVLRGFIITRGFVDAKTGYGAGMLLEDSQATIVECVFTANIAESFGGALVNWRGSPTFVNCRFEANSSGMGAGAVLNRQGGAPTFVNCLFDRNESGDCGAVLNATGDATFTNCTFVRNRAKTGEAGAIFDNPGQAMLRNCVLWDNTAARSGTDAIANSPTLGVKTRVIHSNVQGGWPGQGNINADPLFAGAAAGDFRPQAASPCAASGSRAHLPPDLADLDWDGNKTEPLPIDLGRNGWATDASVPMGAFRRAAP